MGPPAPHAVIRGARGERPDSCRLGARHPGSCALASAKRERSPAEIAELAACAPDVALSCLERRRASVSKKSDRRGCPGGDGTMAYANVVGWPA